MLCVLSACNPPTPPSDRVPKSRPEHPRGLTCSLSTLLFSSSARLRSSSSFRRLSSSSSRLFSSCSRLRCSRSCCLLASRSLLCCCESQDGALSADCPATVPRTACCPLTGRCESGAGGPHLHQPTTSMLSSAHTRQHPQKYRSELGFILISVIPCSSLNHSNEGMTNSVPLSITDRVTQGS